MDYEKKYNEAIKRAKQHCADYVVETIFPELKESEDERIRKAIVELVHDTTGDSLWVDYGVHKEDALAWLEKQGEQKDVNIQINPSEYINDMGGNGCYLKNTAQKPADKVEPKKEDTSELTPFEAELFSVMSDAWQGYQLGEEVNIAEIVKEHSSELLERANKQNLAWSEEDEKKRKCLIKGLEDRMGFGWASDPFSREEYIDWLKSLRPQNTWKPSDEQMNMLRKFIEYFDVGVNGKEILTTLYIDLKKLTVE